MSMHKKPLTNIERNGLEAHGLDIGKPSQLSDCFRLGVAWGQSASIPCENGSNRYGLDMSYFRNLINRELNRPLDNYKPDELARVFARMSMAADPSVMHEDELKQLTKG